jgi:AcrR family transcriptional regulator
MKVKQAAKRPRGRPRSYEPEGALACAQEVFWERGYAGTSLDDLSSATQMHRPSLYRAFGDKEQLFLAILRRYHSETLRVLERVVESELPLQACLLRLFRGASVIYLQGARGAHGCLILSSALTETCHNTAVRELVASNVRALDRLFARRMQRAVAQRELPARCDPGLHAQLASGTLHTLAVRARSGASKKSLDALARHAASLLSAGSSLEPLSGS